MAGSSYSAKDSILPTTATMKFQSVSRAITTFSGPKEPGMEVAKKRQRLFAEKSPMQIKQMKLKFGETGIRLDLFFILTTVLKRHVA